MVDIYQRYKNEILSGVEVADNEFLERLKENGYGFSFDADKTMNTFDKPTLILLGRQDASVGYKDAWAY